MAPWGKASLAFLAGLVGAQGARIGRKGHSQTKFIAGVPVHNYHLAFDSKASLVEGAARDWVVVVAPGTSNEKIHEMCTMLKCVREGHPNQGGMPYFEVHGSESELQKLLELSEGMVKFVEPDAELHMIPELVEQASARPWGLDRIGAPSRNSGEREGDGVNVYVFDTGVRATHEEFGGRVIPALDMTGESLLECDGAIGCAGDVLGGGTQSAGIAAGASLGVAPKAIVRSVKVVPDYGVWPGGYGSWTYDALDWLATKGSFPAVASLPWGTYFVPGYEQQAFKTAVDSAVDAGVVVVVAGGDTNEDPCQFSTTFPPSAITVGSTTWTDARSAHSNYGSCIDIWAPGSDITSASVSSDWGKQSASGTRVACSHVSGAAALVLQENPGWKSPAVLNALLDNAIENVISGLTTRDTNRLLYVGAGGPSPPLAPICPSRSSGPDRNGDCQCKVNTYCYQDGSFCKHSSRGASWSYFSPACSTCECK